MPAGIARLTPELTARSKTMQTASMDRPATPTERDPRWAAVAARDPRADGTFFYSVRTTGVYCRPSCASRPARP